MADENFEFPGFFVYRHYYYFFDTLRKRFNLLAHALFYCI